MTSASEQAKSLQTHAGFWLRSDLSVVRVSGDDRVAWLNGQVTNDLRQLESAGSVRALAVHVRGKIMAELWVLAHGEELLVVLPKAAEATVLESFDRYIIMEDVTLTPWSEVQVLAVLGPQAPQLSAAVSGGIGFSYDDLGLGGHAWIGEPAALASIAEALRAAGAVQIDEQGYELARLRAGIPRYGFDFGERSYPQEAGLKQLVSFNKGCYLGQEVVCTLENRGKLTRQLALWRSSPGAEPTALPTPGTSLKTAADETPGEVTSAVWDPDAAAVLALGYVKRAHATPGTSLTAAGTQLTLERIVGPT